MPDSELDGLLSKGNRKSVDRIFYVGATRAAPWP